MIEIVQNGDPVLRAIAPAVPLEEISSPRIQNIIARMKEALATQDDGVAIAAPQIGESVRIFVVSGRVFDENFVRGEGTSSERSEIPPDQAFINPVLTKLSREKKYMMEGCLSVRPIYGKIKRSTRATVEAYDEYGKKFVRGASGLLAEIFQHEIDHLDGILFIDKAKDLEEITPEERSRRLEEAEELENNDE